MGASPVSSYGIKPHRAKNNPNSITTIIFVLFSVTLGSGDAFDVVYVYFE